MHNKCYVRVWPSKLNFHYIWFRERHKEAQARSATTHTLTHTALTRRARQHQRQRRCCYRGSSACCGPIIRGGQLLVIKTSRGLWVLTCVLVVVLAGSCLFCLFYGCSTIGVSCSSSCVLFSASSFFAVSGFFGRFLQHGHLVVFACLQFKRKCQSARELPHETVEIPG